MIGTVTLWLVPSVLNTMETLPTSLYLPPPPLFREGYRAVGQVLLVGSSPSGCVQDGLVAPIGRAGTVRDAGVFVRLQDRPVTGQVRFQNVVCPCPDKRPLSAYSGKAYPFPTMKSTSVVLMRIS